MTLSWRPGVIGLMGLLAVGCGESPAAPTEDAPPLLTSLPRALTSAESGIAGATNHFGFGLLAQARADDPDATIFLSPLSASMALGMAMNGAAGPTWEGMREALGFGALSQDEINAGYKGLMALLAGLDPTSEMRVANSIWAKVDFPFLPSFIATGQTWFDAEVRNVSFTDPATLAAVNGWVSQKTNAKIPRLLDQFDPDVVMTLLNAIYFKGSWRVAFKQADTRSAPFHAATGVQAVPTMHRDGTMKYAERSGYQAVDLVYGNGGFGMTIVLPREGTTLGSLLGSLASGGWQDLTGGFSDQKVVLSIPRFRLELKRDLSNDLKAMGMALAFDDRQADFSRLAAPPVQLFISSVQQKTFVDVNEEGTEAAAATAVQIGVTSVPQTYVMQVNRPFLVAIRERFSGTILFLGQVTQVPSA